MQPSDELVENEGVVCRKAPKCVLCGRDGCVLYTRLRDRFFSAPGVWQIRWCASCRLAWLDPHPLPEEIPKLYTKYYTHEPPAEGADALKAVRHWIRDGVLASRLGYAELAQSRVQRVVGWLMGGLSVVRDRVELGVMGVAARRRGRLLDVGCGSGEFLARMKALGWEVVGLEPDERAAQLARERWGLRVDVSWIHNADMRETSFDVITMNHVLEHLNDPLGSLQTLQRWLRPSGTIVVTTPNIFALCHRIWKESWQHLDPPRHLFLFSKYSLAVMLRKAGFTNVRLRAVSRGASVTFRVSWYLRAHSARAEQVQAERGVIARLLGGLVEVCEAAWSGREKLGEELVGIGEVEKIR